MGRVYRRSYQYFCVLLPLYLQSLYVFVFAVFVDIGTGQPCTCDASWEQYFCVLFHLSLQSLYLCLHLQYLQLSTGQPCTCDAGRVPVVGRGCGRVYRQWVSHASAHGTPPPPPYTQQHRSHRPGMKLVGCVCRSRLETLRGEHKLRVETELDKSVRVLVVSCTC